MCFKSLKQLRGSTIHDCHCVSVKINDGIIMGADSATTFGIGQIYLTADKMVNLVKGLPIGVMSTGTPFAASYSPSTGNRTL